MVKIQKIRQKLLSTFYSRVYRDTNRDLKNTLLLVGVGRSGTTWLGEIVNHRQDYREIFEPFLPTKVKAASSFAYYQYLSPQDQPEENLLQAQNILSGQVRDQWTDQNLTRLFYKKRIVKEIRGNMMLAWLQTNFPDIPIIFLIRNPFAVAYSWHKLGWGKPYGGQKTIIVSICEQPAFQRDFPALVKRVQDLGYKDSYELGMIAWCILNYVPLQQLADEGVFYGFYEDFFLRSQESLGRLMHFLNLPFEFSSFQKVLNKPSRTNFNQRANFESDEAALRGWEKQLSASQIARGQEILEAFGMQDMYQDPVHPQIIKPAPLT